MLTAGAIADRFGRRMLFLLGVSIFTASSALSGAAGGIEVLVGAPANPPRLRPEHGRGRKPRYG